MALNVLSIQRGQDTGGQSIRLKWAFDHCAPEWTFRSMVRPNAFLYIQYPEDLTWHDARTEWAKADVVHLHNDFRTAHTMKQRGPEKPAVVHYHGSAFRADQSPLVEQRRRGAIGLVSTLDLYLLAPDDLEWLPSPYDIDWLQSLREQ